jgi:hypothetical protein
MQHAQLEMEPMAGIEPATDGLRIRYWLARRARKYARMPRDYNANQWFQWFCESVVKTRSHAVPVLQIVAM